MFAPGAGTAEKKRASSRRVQSWLETHEAAAGRGKFTAVEVVCTTPGCAPIEVLVTLYAAVGERSTKIPVPMVEVTEAALTEAVEELCAPPPDESSAKPDDDSGDDVRDDAGPARRSVALCVVSAAVAVVQLKRSRIVIRRPDLSTACIGVGAALLVYAAAAVLAATLSGRRPPAPAPRHGASKAGSKRSKFSDLGSRLPRGCACCDPRQYDDLIKV
mmetsp:Transcript_120/g.458  ORF Transcript_120/g.458 Transcript_120/m.458 type:complete len:217 (+) Transcript_120:156-806(+)